MNATLRFARRAASLLLLVAGCGGDPPAKAPRPSPAPSAPAATPPAEAGPPRAPVRPVTNRFFGVDVVDPYQWMEDAKAPDLGPWLAAQNDHARAYFARLPARDAIAKRLRELDVGVDEVRRVGAAPGPRGERTFWLKCPGGCAISRLYVREGGGPERLLYDPATESGAGGQLSLEVIAVSPDGAHVALGTAPGGSEQGDVRVLEVATGRFLPDRIDRINFAYWGYVSWVDGRRFLYNRSPQTAPDAPRAEKLKNLRSYLHALGGDPARDQAVLGAGVSPRAPMQDTWVASIDVAAPYAFATVQRGSDPQKTLYVAPLAQLAGDRTPWRQAAAYEDEITDFAARGDELYLLTRQSAPRYKVVRTSLSRPDFARATTVVAESERVLKGVAAAKDGLYVVSTERGLGRVARLAWGETKPADLPLPVEGSAHVYSVDPRRPGVEVVQASWLSSARVYAVGGGKPPADTGLKPPSPIDVSAFEAVEVEATSADGTRVPLSIVHRKGMRRDGSSAAFLRGYGAYGSSIEPSFDPHNVAIVERAVYAVCHVRGGGELGSEWYEQGRKQNKHHTWEDFIACADYLAANKYSAPGKIVGLGYSAGGLCAGNALVHRPDLFGAVILHRANGNPLRMTNPFMLVETGSAETKEGFEGLYAMDPYHHAREGVRYPAVLLTVAMNDARVPHWHATKLAARLQASTASGRPVLLRVEGVGGHGVGATGSQGIEEEADMIAFGLAEVGAR